MPSSKRSIADSSDALSVQKKTRLEVVEAQRSCIDAFIQWNDEDQVEFMCHLLSRMSHSQHSQLNSLLEPLLLRDFISALPARGLPHIAANILAYLDAKSLLSVEFVSRQWQWIVIRFQLWRRLISRRISSDLTWLGLARRRGWLDIIDMTDQFRLYDILLQHLACVEALKRGFEYPIDSRSKRAISPPAPHGDNWLFAASTTPDAVSAAALEAINPDCADATVVAHRFYKRLYPRINQDINVSRHNSPYFILYFC